MQTPDDPCLAAAVNNAFKAAFLLTGNMAAAEYAVLQAIDSLTFNAAATEEILTATVVNCLQYLKSAVTRASIDCEGGWTGLPIELQNVLQLKTTPRSCFVLRRLLNFSVDDCARLLTLAPHQVETRTCAAMLRLASIANPFQEGDQHDYRHTSGISLAG